ncbi:hypothetical protein Gotri_026385, partial [Gossypium trilobum]|nr:hypothetical protein [Gossypium trilobum]
MEIFNWLEKNGLWSEVFLIAKTCWSLWKERNELIFDNRACDPIVTWNRALLDNPCVYEGSDQMEAVHNTTSVRVAEALGFNSCQKRRQWQSIIFESYNKQLIYLVKNKSFTCWGSIAIEQDIVSLLNSVSACFAFIPWTANKAVDWIVQCARKRICPLDWVSSVPLFLSSLLERDAL